MVICECWFFFYVRNVEVNVIFIVWSIEINILLFFVVVVFIVLIYVVRCVNVFKILMSDDVYNISYCVRIVYSRSIIFKYFDMFDNCCWDVVKVNWIVKIWSLMFIVN